MPKTFSDEALAYKRDEDLRNRFNAVVGALGLKKAGTVNFLLSKFVRDKGLQKEAQSQVKKGA